MCDPLTKINNIGADLNPDELKELTLWSTSLPDILTLYFFQRMTHLGYVFADQSSIVRYNRFKDKCDMYHYSETINDLIPYMFYRYSQDETVDMLRDYFDENMIEFSDDCIGLVTGMISDYEPNMEILDELSKYFNESNEIYLDFQLPRVLSWLENKETEYILYFLNKLEFDVVEYIHDYNNIKRHFEL